MLKKLLQSLFPPAVVEETVDVEELDSWVDGKVAKVALNSFVEEWHRTMKDLHTSIGPALDDLEKAELSEKEKTQIEARVQNVVAGHKIQYLRELRQFVEDFEHHSGEGGLMGAYDHNVLLNDRLQEVGAKTAKSYQATQHLFSKQVEPIFKLLGEMNLLVKKFEKKFSEHKLNRVGELREQINRLKKEMHTEKYLAAEIEAKEKELSGLALEEKGLGLEKEKLFADERYGQHSSLLEIKEGLLKRKKAYETSVFEFFAKLSKSMKKYSRFDGKLIGKYVGDSVQAFCVDDTLTIVDEILAMKNFMKKQDDKQQKVYAQMLEKINQGYLGKLKKEQIRIKARLEEVEASLRGNKVMEEIEACEDKLGKVFDRMDFVQKELKDLRETTPQVEAAKEEIKKLALEVFTSSLSFS